MLNKEQLVDFKLSQALLIFLLSTAWVILTAGAIEYFQWQIVSGLLIHGGIIIIAAVCTAMIIKSLNISVLFNRLSFKKANWTFYITAIALALIIWLADFWLQYFFFQDNGKTDGLALQKEINHFGAFSIVIASCFLAPVAEELLFRSILLKGLLTRINPLGAILISSLLFAGIHFSSQDFISLFVAAASYAILTIKSQSIQPAILAHLINNSMTVYYLSTL